MDIDTQEQKTRIKEAGVVSEKAQRIIFIISFMAWPVLHWLVFYVGTNATSFFMAFQVIDRTTGTEVFSFKNFIRIFKEGFSGVEPLLLEGLRNTSIFFFFNLIVRQPLTWAISYFLYKKIVGYKAFRFIFYLPAILPALALQMSFRYVISTESSSVLSTIFAMFGVKMPDLLGSSEYAMKTMLVYQFIYGWSGFVVTVGMLRRIPMEVIDAGQLDGVTPLIEWFRILMPMIWPMIEVGLMMSVLGFFDNSGPVLVFTQGKYGTYTIGYWMFERIYNTSDMNYASAAGLFFTVVLFPILFIVTRLTKKVEVVEY